MMKDIFKEDYFLWGLYYGLLFAEEYNLFDFLDNQEVNSALYGYWDEEVKL